jgi:GABA(A) receptor-associated protein
MSDPLLFEHSIYDPKKEKRTQMNTFKANNTLKARKTLSHNIQARYPQRIPVVVERDCTLPLLDKSKFITPFDLTLGQFVSVLRKRIKLEPEHALFVFVGQDLAPNSSLLGKLYHEYADEDGFLYLYLASENTFGNQKNET